MSDLPESTDWAPGIYQLETSDPVLGGPDGIDNLQAKQLANRTRWLKDQLDRIISGATSIGIAIKLATARTLSVSGAATGSALFDGSANANIALTLADSGAVAGSYAKVTINVKGLVVAGSSLVAADIPALDWSKITTGRPTTLAGYGITDALSATGNAVSASKLVTARTISISGAATGNAAFDGSANANIALTLADSGAVAGSYAKVTINAKGLVVGSAALTAADIPALDWSKISSGKPTTLSGYGITDAYTKVQSDQAAASFFASQAPFRGTRVYQTSGVSAWDVPQGVVKAWVTVIGAGGGGGCSPSATGNGSAGGGGGGTSQRLVDLTGIASVTVTVGSGGAGATAAGSPGGTGGTSSFGVYLSATGGAGGSGNSAAGNAPGNGGLGSGGIINSTLGPGAPNYGVSGGSGGGPGPRSTQSSTPGDNGIAPGAGGAGAYPGYAGGNGAPGIVIIQW